MAFSPFTHPKLDLPASDTINKATTSIVMAIPPRLSPLHLIAIKPPRSTMG
jgi:hypothetical protein